MQISRQTNDKQKEIFKDYFNKNKLNNKEYCELINLKQDIFKVLDAKDLDKSNKLQDELISKNYQKNKFTDKLIWKFTIHYYKKLTTHIKNADISPPNNKIENIVQKLFLKHIKE